MSYDESMNDDAINSAQLAAEAGITYRQLDHWTTRGYIKPITLGGTGHSRMWPPEECRVAVAMARLIRAGLVIDAAHDIARAGFPRAVLAILAERRS